MSQKTVSELKALADRLHNKSMKLADWDHRDLCTLVRELGEGFKLIAKALEEKTP